MAPSTEQSALLDAAVDASYITLAKGLAANHRRERDNAVAILQKMIMAQAAAVTSHPSPPLQPEDSGNSIATTISDVGMLKLWKGLFYCMWMSDKPHVQHALACQLAGVMKLFPRGAADSLRYCDAFWRILCREWHGIDYLRMDKYYDLVRQMIIASFQALAEAEWDAQLVHSFNSILQGGPLCTDSTAPRSLRYYVCENYLPLLLEATGGKQEADDSCNNVSTVVSKQTLVAISRPIFNLMLLSGDKATINNIQAGFIDVLAASCTQEHVLAVAEALWSRRAASSNEFRIRTLLQSLTPTCPAIAPLLLTATSPSVATAKEHAPSTRSSHKHQHSTVTVLMNGMRKRKRAVDTFQVLSVESEAAVAIAAASKKEVLVQQAAPDTNDNEVDVSPAGGDEKRVRWAASNRVMRFNKLLPPVHARPAASTNDTTTDAAKLKSNLKRACRKAK